MALRRDRAPMLTICLTRPLLPNSGRCAIACLCASQHVNSLSAVSAAHTTSRQGCWLAIINVKTERVRGGRVVGCWRGARTNSLSAYRGRPVRMRRGVHRRVGDLTYLR
jgi:hypothetical protein